jgi:pimeloyl-ACP methyl ester carboxylesterase
MPDHSGIHYSDQGNEYPVLLIHGFCETSEIWNSFSEKISTRFRVLSIDLPGFGGSDMLPEPFSLSDVATRVLRWLYDLKIETCMVIGHSLGGYVTLAMAEQQPEKIKAFGLFHSTAYADSEERKQSRNKVIEFVSAHGVGPFVESFIPPLFYNQANPHIPHIVKLAGTTRKESLIAYVKAMRDRPDRTTVLRDFHGKILLLAGEMDSGIPLETVKKQALLSSHSDLKILPSVAHMGMFEDEVTSLAEVTDFLTKNRIS